MWIHPPVLDIRGWSLASCPPSSHWGWVWPLHDLSLVAQMGKNLPAMQETWIQSLGQEEPLEKGMATHYRFLAWRIRCTEEPGGLQSMGPQRVGHQWATKTFTRPLRIHWDGTEAWSSGLVLMPGDSCITGSCARAILSELGYWWSISCLLRQDEKAAGLQDLRSSDTLLPQPLWTRAECSFLRNTHTEHLLYARRSPSAEVILASQSPGLHPAHSPVRKMDIACVHALSDLSHVQLCVDCSPPDSSVHGILQERLLEWVAMPLSRGSSWFRDQNWGSHVFCIGRWVLYH